METLKVLLYIVVGIVLVFLCAATGEGTLNKALKIFTIAYFFPIIIVAYIFIHDVVAPSKR